MSDEVTTGNAVFLQPDKVGSSIRYTVTVYGTGQKAWADVAIMLTDCDRKICWSGNPDDLVLKIDRAVAILTEARKKTLVAKAEVVKRKRMK